MHNLIYPGVFPPYHTFIHDDEDAIISMSLVFVGIYMYTFIWHAQTLIQSWSFSPFHKLFMMTKTLATVSSKRKKDIYWY